MGAAVGRLAGKVALITGAATGIGRAIAERFTEEGAAVAIADIDGAAARVAAGEIAGAHAVTLDVAARDLVSAGVAETVERLGGIDVVVNNAGISVQKPVTALADEEWDRQFDVNLRGVYLVSKLAWPHLLARRGCIVNIGSIAGFYGIPDEPAYCSSKAGVIMLTKMLALEGAAAGVRANSVSPGTIVTPATTTQARQIDGAEGGAGGILQAVTDRCPLGRLGLPGDVANATLFLASDEAAWITGSDLVVDGGTTIGMWGAFPGYP